MANAVTEIKRVEFIIGEELTHCNLFIVSSEPDNAFWGNGWRTKTFPKEKSAVDILNENVKDYLKWDKGRNHPTSWED